MQLPRSGNVSPLLGLRWLVIVFFPLVQYLGVIDQVTTGLGNEN